MTDSTSGAPTAATPHVDESLVTYTHVVYALHALAVLVGLSAAHTIVGSFVGSFPSIIAVIMNYARRSATYGTYLESHFRWQIRTFWYALLWAVLIVVLSMPLMLVIIGFGTAIIGLWVLGIWIAYRVIRGWLALKDRRPMYV
jgi:uncharacterized membrane protein